MINKNGIVWDFHQFLIPSCRTKVEFYCSLILFRWLLFVSFINWMSVKKRSQIGYKETLKNITNDKTVTDYRIWPQIWTLMQYMSINEIYKKTLSRIQIELYSSRFCIVFFRILDHQWSLLYDNLSRIQIYLEWLLDHLHVKHSLQHLHQIHVRFTCHNLVLSDVTLCYVGSRNFVIRV